MSITWTCMWCIDDSKQLTCVYVLYGSVINKGLIQCSCISRLSVFVVHMQQKLGMGAN